MGQGGNMFRKLLALLAVLFVSACADMPTSPTDEVSVSFSNGKAQPARSDWYTWSFFLPPMCGSPALVDGLIDVHIVGRFVTNPDGTTSYREHLNSARGTAEDVLGNEYVLIQRASNHNESELDGSFVSQSTFIFKVVPKGSGPVQNLELGLEISWDPVAGFQVSSSATITCRGG